MRFYTTLLLKDLLSDAPIDKVAEFYELTIGEIQAFQQRCVSLIHRVRDLMLTFLLHIECLLQYCEQLLPRTPMVVPSQPTQLVW